MMDQQHSINHFSDRSSQIAFAYLEEHDLLPFLSQLVVSLCENGERISIYDANDLKSRFDDYLDSLGIGAKTQYRSELELRRLSDTVNLLHAKTISDYKLIDIIHMITSIKEDIMPYPFSEPVKFDYSREELYDLKIVIQKFSSFKRFFNQEGLKANELSKYNKEIFAKHDIQSLKNQVNLWCSELDSIIRMLALGIKNVDRELKSDLLSALNADLELVESNIDKIDNYQSSYQLDEIIKPSVLSFDRKSKAAYKAWKQILSDLDFDQEISKPSEAVSILNENCAQLRIIYKAAKQGIDKDLKGITELNTNEESIHEGCQRLKDILNQINDYNLYDLDQECNSHNLAKKISFISNLRNELNIFLQHDHLQSAIEWYNCKDSLNSDFKNFLNQLEALPQGEWKMQFEYFYLSSFLDHIDIELNGSTSELLDFKIVRTHLQKRTHSLYNTITDRVTWLNILNEEDLILRPKKVISINNPIDHTNAININSSTTTDEINIPYTLDTDSDLSEIHPSKLLQHVKKIAHNLLPYLNKATGFQLRGGNVISTIHPHWQYEVSDYLTNNGGKSFDISSLTNLIDFLLSVDRPLFILTQDGILSSNQSIDLNQFTILDDLKSNGIKFINLSTFETLNDKSAAFNSLYHQLPIVSKSKTVDHHVHSD